jgi:ABC-type transport system involved in cytochrome c biogenesis ATPase subunit
MPVVKKKFTMKERLAFYQSIANKQADIIANVRVSLGADEEVPAELLGNVVKRLVKENKRLKGKSKK